MVQITVGTLSEDQAAAFVSLQGPSASSASGSKSDASSPRRRAARPRKEQLWGDGPIAVVALESHNAVARAQVLAHSFVASSHHDAIVLLYRCICLVYPLRPLRLCTSVHAD